MKIYHASAIINATPQKIWEILVDGNEYPSWDPGIIRVEGTFAKGERVKFFTQFSPNKAFSVTITQFDPGKKMVLRGGLPFGLFTSERTHLIAPRPDGKNVTVITEEVFSGLLYPLFGAKIPDLTESFQNFVSGLKRQSEAI